MKALRLGIIIGLMTIFAGLPVKAQSSGWLDPAWPYRNKIAINNPGATSLANFQVHVALDSSFDFSLAKSDGSDIRLTMGDGTTAVPFWIESWNPSAASASIWAQVPTVPASGTAMYIYFGNPAATGISSGAATFDFFDDFDSGGSQLFGYYPISQPVTPMPLVQDQSWESDPPHTFSVVQANAGGYQYWGYYGLAGGCGGVGLAWSNDLTNWTKNPGNPLLMDGRWPSVLLVNGVYYMAYEKDYCADSYIVLATSSDGVNFVDVKALVQPQSGLRNQNPHLWRNPNDGQYYLYYYNGDDLSNFNIRVRRASTIMALDTASDTTLIHSTISLAAPNMLYAGGTYYLATETRNPATSVWETNVYGSSSASSGFTLLPGNPVLSPGACMFQNVFGNIVHEYYCDFDHVINNWTLKHRTADITSQRQSFYVLDATKWANGGGSWLITQDTQQDGTTGNVLMGTTAGRQILSSASFTGSDYVLEAYGKQVTGRVWGLASRVQDANNLYSANLYDDLGTSDNLYTYRWSAGSAFGLGSAPVGPIAPNAWYKLTMKVHGSSIDVYKDNIHQISTSDSLFPSGAVAVYGEDGGAAEFNNILVRKYAAIEPTTTLTPKADELLASVVLNPAAVLGGDTSVATVTLAIAAPQGGAIITLSSDDPSAASVPASVTISAGSTSGSVVVNTSAVTTSTTATITAVYNGETQSATLTVTPLLASLALSPNSVLAGDSAVGTISLAAAAPVGGALITLSSSNPSAASVPPTMTVPGGATSATFAVTTGGVAGSSTATITATYNGQVQAASIAVNPLLSSVTVNPGFVLMGNSSVGTVSLAGPAPAGGVAISLSSSDPSAAAPSSVTVPAGATTASFGITSNSVAALTVVTISATYNNATQSTSLTVTPPGGGWLDPAWMYRSVVAITNPGGAALTNYEVQVTLSSPFDFTRVRSDGADLRFTDIDGATPLPYWIESWNPAQQSATLWVRVPAITAGGTTVYLYYGNSAVSSSTSNGDQTFEFFDDFSTATINPSKWTASGGTWSVISDNQEDGAVGLVAQGNTSARQMLSSSYSGTDYVLQVSGKQAAGRVWGIGVRANSPSNLYAANLYDDLGTTNNLYVYSWINNSGSGATATLGTAAVGQVNSNTWYKVTAKVHGSGIDIYKDGVLQVQAIDSNLASGGVALIGEVGTVAEFNNVFVRQYAAIEPTATVDAQTGLGVASLALSPTTVEGGSSSQGTVVLTGPATAGGTVVFLTSSDTATATVPASVTVPSGSTSATFTVNTNTVAIGTPVSISASYGSTSQSGTLTATPQSVSSLTLAPGSVLGGTNSTATVTLAAPAPAGGAVVALSSSNTAAAQVPASVTVAANATTATFTVTTSPVASDAAVTISATYGSTQNAGLTVTAALNAVSLNPGSVVGGTSSTGTVTLSGPAPAGGALVLLSSSDTASAQVPASVTVPADATTATFSITTSPVASDAALTISGTYGATQNAGFTVSAAVANSVSLNPSSVQGGTSLTGTVTLSGPAPAGGAVVTLASSDTVAAQVPASVTVAANATTAAFTITTSPVTSDAAVTISATRGATQNAGFTVMAPAITVSSVTLNPTSVVGGSSSTGTVTLSGPAPAGSAVVTLSSSDPTAAQVPTSVTVAPNATTATFQVASSPVVSNTSLTISATYGATQNASFTVTAPVLSSVNLSPASVFAGSSATGTVTLTGPAPAGGAVVMLSSSNATAAQVPASVTVAPNATTATFTATSSSVASNTSLTISGIYGATQTASFSVVAIVLNTVTLNPTSVLGGNSTTGTVTLSSPAPAGGAVVTLSSNNTAAAQVPASVTVAANATTVTFSVTTSPVAGNTTVTVSGTYNATRTVSLTVTAAVLSTTAVSPTSVVGGNSATGTVTLNGRAPVGGAMVTLSSSNTAAARVPVSVTVAANATTATFTVTTSPVTSNTTVTLSGTYGVTRTASFTVNSAVVNSVTLNPTSVLGGNSSTGTVTLSGAAPVGGAVVTLSSSNIAAAQVPASVTVAANATTAAFTVTTSPVASNTSPTISATYGATRTASLTVTAATLSTIAVNPTPVVGGNTTTGTVTLTGRAPAGGAVVTLSSNRTATGQVPASVTVPANATTATFTVTTSPVVSNTSVTISGTYGVTRTVSFVVQAPTMASLTLNPTTVKGGAPSTGTVTLTGAAPTGGTVVTLSSSRAAVATVPASVTVTAGNRTATFMVTTRAVLFNNSITITATRSTASTAVLRVTP